MRTKIHTESNEIMPACDTDHHTNVTVETRLPMMQNWLSVSRFFVATSLGYSTATQNVSYKVLQNLQPNAHFVYSKQVSCLYVSMEISATVSVVKLIK
jgi:hypothetical protein